MSKKTPAGKVSAALEDAIADEIKEVTKKDAEGKYLHPTIDRMRVIDKALKLEAIKAKLPDDDYGTGFKTK